ncbi:MAG: hypothetical protein L6R38_002854 [Xanthoria sp. 2 TBL-2021]|nr:MAG: hypothetical protein L6R38_002854 [Xanthoria sp. 2 TBL-2021]
MTFLSRALLVIATVLLSHACYSAYEHASHISAITSRNRSPSSSIHPTASSSPAPTALPLDISIETVVSVVLICVGLVMDAEQLKPINWQVWAGQVEKESGGGGPFQGLENRVGFMDIRKQRKEFADWVREKGSAKGA